uniref:Gamma-interferon-inducible lysosomal thiol reductase n=1 Tax=Globodera rostochiensis TaxID=31243 RepID=A0A914GSA9_GLORO
MLSTPLFPQFFALLLPPLYIATLAQSSFIQIGVLFESLCPDSINFILGPLSDADAKFKQHIQLELVPFGKATIHEDGEITCQHGKYECQINKFLGNTAKKTSENGISAILGRMVRGADPDDWKQLAQDCYLHLDIDSETITKTRTCANGPEGDALQRVAGQRTYSIEADPMTFVPWILWNNGSNEEVQKESREDLKPFICGHLKKANIDQANCA